MAIIHKRGARQVLTRGKPTAQYYPHGVEGMVHSLPCISMVISEHAVFMTLEEFQEWQTSLKQVDPDVHHFLFEEHT